MDITASDLHAVLPAATGANVDKFIGPLNSTMAEFNINSPLRQAHFLAQVGYESGSLRYVREIASGDAYEGRLDLGNNRPGDGRRFKGGGLLQITGRTNYLDCGREIGVDLIAKPELIEEPDTAARSAGWFWFTHGLNDLADMNDIRKVTKRINGGLTGLAGRIAIFERAKDVFGIL